jgi:hypothetical protein
MKPQRHRAPASTGAQSSRSSEREVMNAFSRIIRPTDTRAWLTQRARELSAGRAALFHGTRYLSEILADGYLQLAVIGDSKVCFSRNPGEAARWATIPRDDDEGRGAVLAFDRDRLRMRYRLELIDDSWSGPRAEAEEYISSDVPLGVALLGIVAEPFSNRFRVERREVWRRRAANLRLLETIEAGGRSLRGDGGRGGHTRASGRRVIP